MWKGVIGWILFAVVIERVVHNLLTTPSNILWESPLIALCMWGWWKLALGKKA